MYDKQILNKVSWSLLGGAEVTAVATTAVTSTATLLATGPVTSSSPVEIPRISMPPP